MKTFFTALAFAVLIASPCLAAEPAPKADAHLAAALDVLEATRAHDNMAVLVDTITPMLLAQVKQQHPDASDKVLAAFQSAVKEELEGSYGDLMTMQAAIYAEHFSEADLKALASFYRSDVGKHFIAEQPAMMKELGPAVSAWGRQTAHQAIERATEKLQKEGMKL